MTTIAFHRPCLLGLAALAAILLGSPVNAQATRNFTGLQVRGDQPVAIESNQLDVDDGKALATFTGDVTVQQGPTELKTGKLVVYYRRDGQTTASNGTTQPVSTQGTPGALPGGSDQIDKLEATDKVFVRSADQTATAAQATFDMKSKLVTMAGDVVLTQGKNVVKGCRLTIRMDTGVARLDNSACPGGRPGGRVQMMLTPGSQPTN